MMRLSSNYGTKVVLYNLMVPLGIALQYHVKLPALVLKSGERKNIIVFSKTDENQRPAEIFV